MFLLLSTSAVKKKIQLGTVDSKKYKVGHGGGRRKERNLMDLKFFL